MAEHHELVAEMPVLEQMGTQERQKLAKKRRNQQLKRWNQREKEWLAKDKQLNKRLANKISEENNGLNLKQYTTYSSNHRQKKTATSATTTTTGTKNNNNNIFHKNNNGLKTISRFQANDGPKTVGLAPNGRVHFNVGIMLLEAAARNDYDEVKRLLMLGVSPDSVNHDGLTALHQCCIDASEPIMSLLLEFGANVDARDTEQWTPLHAACTCGHLNLVKILVGNGADLLAVNGDGNMPFDICEDEATLDYIETQMVERGITQEMIDQTRASTEMQMIADLEKLIASGADDLNGPLENGATPLHIAAANGYLSVVQLLIEHSVDVNVCDNDRWTPLHGVACWGNEQHTKVVELLVEAGAQLDLKTSNDETAFDLCDNAELLEKLNQLKDDLASKQAASNPDLLKRTQSKSNSRIHSVRRTSVRDKNQISRREAREEAMLRVDSSTAVTNGLDQSQQVTVQDGPKSDVIVPNGGLITTSFDDNTAPDIELPHKIEAQTMATRDRPQANGAAKSSLADITVAEMNGPDQADSKSRLTRDLPYAQEICSHNSNDTACDVQDYPDQGASTLVPFSYTLSNLKKQRSDLRMRTTSIGGSTTTIIVTANSNGTVSLNPKPPNNEDGAPIVDESRSGSPSGMFRKFSGEPSGVIGEDKRESRHNCCIVI